MSNIHAIRPKKNNTGFIMRTRDLCDMSRQTMPPLLAEKDIDVYWLDGSRTEDGTHFAATSYHDLPGLCETHTGIDKGTISSFLYGVKLLLDRDYEYLGFIEGDVQVKPGWLQRIQKLYEEGKHDGLHVGSVSARCIEDRILVPRDGYAVMANSGAGMVMMHRDVFTQIASDPSKCVFDNPVFKMSDIQKEVKAVTGVDYPVNWRMTRDMKEKQLPPGAKLDWAQSTDWWWEVIMLKLGMVALAPTPSFAMNIDPEGSKEPIATRSTSSNPSFDWGDFVKRLEARWQANPAAATGKAS